MRTGLRATARALLCVPVCALVAGCASPMRSATFEVQRSEYSRAFDAAKGALRDRGFTLDRIDARAGVLSTHPRAGSGLATPWLNLSPGVANTVRATLQPERRVVTVWFDVDGGSPDGEAGAPRMRGRVEATILRLYRPLLRYDATSVRLRTQPVDPRATEAPARLVDAGADASLESRIAASISARLR